MAVKDLDTPLHRLMNQIDTGDYAKLTTDFADYVKQDFEERVRFVQRFSKEKRSFIFLISFINKVRRKQFDIAQDHLRSARQEYEKFMLQYESLPGRKETSAAKPYPEAKENEQPPSVVRKETPVARSPVYSPLRPQHLGTPPRPKSVPRTEIENSVLRTIVTEPKGPESDTRRSVKTAVKRAEDKDLQQFEKERERERYPLPVIKNDQETLITREKRVRELKSKALSYSEFQDELLPWLPDPEDVRPKFDDEGDDDNRTRITVNRNGFNLEDRHVYSNVYDAYKRSLETSVLLKDKKLQPTDFFNNLRPSKLAQGFLDLYFREYALAFEELNKRGVNTQNTVSYLLQIVTKAYKHCQTAEERNLIQNRNLREEMLLRSGLYGVKTTEYQVQLNSQVEQRRLKAIQLLPYVREDFLLTKYPRILPRNIVTECLRAVAYAEKCIEICWWMRVLEPPISMEWAPDRIPGQSFQPFNRDLYGPFTKVGSHLEYTVWPALLLYKYGPVLSKGIAQGTIPYM